MSTVTDQLLLRIAVEGGAVAAGEVEAFNAKIGETEAVANRAARGTKGLGSALSSIKALAAGFTISAAVKQFSTFQAQMERLKTQTGSTQAEVGKMSNGILAMAASVGTGPTSLAQAMYHIESAGYRGSTALKALRIAAEGAQVGGADLTDTTTSLTALMVAGFTKGKNAVQQMQSAMGQLNAIVGAGDMTFQDLNAALTTGVIGQLPAYGLKVKDLGAALAVLGDNNIRGAAAATRFGMGLSSIIKPSSTVVKALAQLGFGQFTLANDLRKPNGLLVMLTAVKQKYDELSKSQGKAVATADISAIFGSGRNSKAMLLLMEQLDRLKTKYDAIGQAGGTFQQDWQATQKNLSFFISQVKAFAEVLLIKLGPALQWVANKIQDFVHALTDGKPWAKAIAALGGVVLGFYAVRKVLGWFLGPVQAAIRVMRILATSGVPGLIRSFLGLDAAATTAAGEQGIGGMTGAIRGTLIPAFANLAKAAGVAALAWIFFKGAMDRLKSPQTKTAQHVGPVPPVVAAFGPAAGPGGLPSPHSPGDGSSTSLFGDIGSGNWGAVANDFNPLNWFASGGVQPTSDWAVVGERGPEVVHLPGGSRVYPHGEMPGGLSGGTFHLEAEIPVTLVMPNGRVLARENVRQGLMAQARKGTGGPTLITEG